MHDIGKIWEIWMVVLICMAILIISALLKYTGVYCSYRIRYETNFIIHHMSPGSQLDQHHLEKILRNMLVPNVCSSEQFEAHLPQKSH